MENYIIENDVMENDVMYNIMGMLRGRYSGRKFPATFYDFSFDDIQSIIHLMRDRFDDAAVAWTCRVNETTGGGELFLVWIDEDICLREQLFGWRN